MGCGASKVVGESAPVEATYEPPAEAPERTAAEGVKSAEPAAAPAAAAPAAPPAAEAAPAAADGAPAAPRRLTVLHFNDVYNLEPSKKEPCGGAARFCSALQAEAARIAGEEGALPPFVTFAGDALNPSLASTLFKGQQMVPVLELLGIHVATIGNHDLDFGTDNVEHVMRQTSFPWLLANIIDRSTGEPLCGAAKTAMVDHHGFKVGVVGLAEKEWIATLNTVQESQLEYLDFVEEGRRLAVELRGQGADVVLALTHMREYNDELLASKAPEFDLVLGGHDHHYVEKVVEPHSVPLIKAGTEFRHVGRAELTVGSGSERPAVNLPGRLDVTSEFPEDERVNAVIEEYAQKLGDSMDVVIGATAVPLDGRFTHVRTQETNLGNLVCDLLRLASGADMTLLNGGTLRSDVMHPPGPITFRDLVSIVPMLDETVVLEMKGTDVKLALENACSQYPKLEGRFAQVSGVKYTFDAALEPGGRVVEVECPPGVPLEDDRLYKVNTKEYLSNGKDGYDVFLGQKVLQSGEVSPIIPTVLRNHLLALEVLSKFKGISSKSHTERAAHAFKALSKSRTHRAMEEDLDEGHARLAQYDEAHSKYVLAPKLQGRIVTLNPVPEAA